MATLAPVPHPQNAGGICLLSLHFVTTQTISKHSVLQLRTSKTCLCFSCIKTLLPSSLGSLYTKAADTGERETCLKGSFPHGFPISGPASVLQHLSKGRLSTPSVRAWSGKSRSSDARISDEPCKPLVLLMRKLEHRKGTCQADLPESQSCRLSITPATWPLLKYNMSLVGRCWKSWSLEPLIQWSCWD